MNFPDYSEYLKLPGKLETEEREWLANPNIHQKYAEVVNEISEKYRDNDILEIGCATGNLITYLKRGILYHGVDKSSSAIEIAKTKVPQEIKGLYLFHNSDIREFAFGSRTWGIVCCFAFLKHFALHEWDEVFQKCASLGKYFIFSMQIAEDTYDDGTEFHHVWKSIDGLNKSIYDAGLTLVKVYDEKSVEPIFVCRKKD